MIYSKLMLGRIKAIIWFLKKPKYIMHIFQILKQKRNYKLESTREESLLWCMQNCVSQEKALQQILNIRESEKLSFLFPNEIRDAKLKARSCPVKMGGKVQFHFYII